MTRPPPSGTTAVADLSYWDVRIQQGAGVFGCDGPQVGTVVALGPDHLVVEPGRLTRTRYRYPDRRHRRRRGR